MKINKVVTGALVLSSLLPSITVNATSQNQTNIERELSSFGEGTENKFYLVLDNVLKAESLALTPKDQEVVIEYLDFYSQKILPEIIKVMAYDEKQELLKYNKEINNLLSENSPDGISFTAKLFGYGETIDSPFFNASKLLKQGEELVVKDKGRDFERELIAKRRAYSSVIDFYVARIDVDGIVNEMISNGSLFTPVDFDDEIDGDIEEEVVMDEEDNIVFSDTIGHWGEKAIQNSVRLNLFNGYNDGTFKPNNGISREEISAVVSRYLNLEKKDTSKTSDTEFSDIDHSRWSYKYIDTMRSNSLIRGYTDGTFKPEQNLTRSEFASVAKRILDREYLDYEKMKVADRTFFDVSESHWAIEDITLLGNIGVMVGDTSGNFNPDNNITRAEIAVIMGRLKEISFNSNI